MDLLNVILTRTPQRERHTHREQDLLKDSAGVGRFVLQTKQGNSDGDGMQEWAAFGEREREINH